MSRPRTQEQWLVVLDIIDLFLARLRAGDYERLRQMLGPTGPEQAPEPEQPFCWVVPGALPHPGGFVDGSSTNEGLYTKPLYEPPARKP